MSRPEEPAQLLPATVRLIESGLQLVRAELAFAVMQARLLAGRAAGALVATVIAASFAQLTLLLLVLTPILVSIVPTASVLISVAISAGLSLLGGLVALGAWRSVQRERAHQAAADGASGGESTSLQALEAVTER